MKTRYYERTAYRLLQEPLPACFLRLDDHFDRTLSVAMPRGASTHVAVLMAESICARMAETEWYALQMLGLRKRHGMDNEADLRAAVLNRAYVVGYLGVARALLDACASTLATVHDLMLGRAERTFASPLFWQTLVDHAPNVHRRYHTSRLFFNEVFRWGGEVTDRIVPLEMVYATFGHYTTRDSHTKIMDEADTDFATLAYIHRTYNWTDPPTLHDRWKPHFLTLCDKLCGEIESSLPIRE